MQGHGDSAKQCTPKLVEPLSPLTVTRVASYNEHTVAVCDRPEEDEHTVMLSASFLRDLRGLVNNPDFSDVTLVGREGGWGTHGAQPCRA